MQPVQVQVDIAQSAEGVEDHYEGITLIRGEIASVSSRVASTISGDSESHSHRSEQRGRDEQEAHRSLNCEHISINETEANTAEENVPAEENTSDEALDAIELPPPLPPKKAATHDLELSLPLGMEGTEQFECIQKRSEITDLIKAFLSAGFSESIVKVLLSLLPSVEGEFSDVKMNILTILFHEYSLPRNARMYKYYETLCRDPHKIQEAIKNRHDDRQRIEKLFYSCLSDLMERNQLNKQVVIVITKTSDPVLDPLLLHVLREYKYKSSEDFLLGTKSFSYAFINAVFLHVYFFMEQSEIVDRENVLLHVLKLMDIIIEGLNYRRKVGLAYELKSYKDHSDYESMEACYLEYEGEIIRSLLMRCGELWNSRSSAEP